MIHPTPLTATPLTADEALRLLNSIGAIVTGSHIVYTSGKHGSAYVNKDAIYPYTQLTSQLCHTLAERFAKSDIEVVIAPVLGGIILSQWVAYHLTLLTGREVLGVYAEKDEKSDSFVIKRGYDQCIRGKRVLVVEDILNTGGSVKKVVEVVRTMGGQVIGLGALCNRGNVTTQDVGNVPELFSLMTIQMDAWDEKDCPLCLQDIPIHTGVGKGREYLARKIAQNYR